MIKQGKNTLCAAETGSGKTLAYLLPLMQRLMDEAELTEVRPGLPRAIVLVPVGELARQIWVSTVKCHVELVILRSQFPVEIL